MLGNGEHAIDLLRDLFGGNENALPHLGEYNAPGRALQHFLTQQSFEHRNSARHGGSRQPQLFGGAAKTAGVHHTGKDH